MIFRAFYENENRIGDVDNIIDFLESVANFEFDSERYRFEMETEQYDEDEEILISKDHNCYIQCLQEEDLIKELEEQCQTLADTVNMLSPHFIKKNGEEIACKKLDLFPKMVEMLRKSVETFNTYYKIDDPIDCSELVEVLEKAESIMN